MRKIKILIIFILFYASIIVAAEVITNEEEHILKRMLLKQNLADNSLEFLKDWSGSTKFKLPVVNEILNNPLQFPHFVDKIEENCQEEQKQILEFYGEYLFQATSRVKAEKLELKKYFNEHVSKPKDILDYGELLFCLVTKKYNSAWDSLNTEEMQKLEYFSYSVWSEKEDSLKYDKFFKRNNITKYEKLDIEEDIVPIIEKIEFEKIIEAATIFLSGYSILKNNFKKIQFDNLARIETHTKYGKFCIGSPTDDTYYDCDYNFMIDPGGNDKYYFKNEPNFGSDHSLLLDMSGDDLYDSNDIAALFSAIGGLNINHDVCGNDIYRGDDISFATLFGYQMSYDEKGDDFYKTGLYSLAAGTFGISILVDSTGNDIYSTTELGEGFGGTLGAGILVDYNGADNYLAGGKYYHSPLAPHDYRSLAQGFGFGLRPSLAGGIGVLYDKSDNDSYQGGVYAQGVGYWYALGILIDGKGNDFYDAVYYPQGSGIHLAGGFLLDKQGEDHYYSKHGPGQGAAHDYGVGFLVDRGGNDRYSVEGGNGLGLTNSVGVFLDVKGDDLYQSPSSQYGNGKPARHSGSIGLFLDTGGNDYYPHPRCANDTVWSYGKYGIGFDTLMVDEDKMIIEKESNAKELQVDSLASIEKIFDIASEWQVGNNKKRVAKARKILLSRENETAEFIYNERLDTKSGLVFRAIEDFLKNSDAYEAYIEKGLQDQDSIKVKNTMAIIGILKDTTYVDKINSFVEEGRYLKTSLQKLGELKSPKSAEILKKFISHPSEKVRVITARALLNLDTEKSREYLKSMKKDKSFLIRSMVKMKFTD